MNEPHQRRVRYKGTHPVKFKEKYKELAPDKYVDDVKKVMARGQTPAGMHVPICVKEIIKFLDLKPGAIGLDCTLGYGGHTTEMLKRISPEGHLTSLDVDSIEFPKTVERIRALGFDEKVFNPRKMNFAGIAKLVAEQGRGFDFILADLGVSSMQIDSPDRGFSFKVNSLLDLRLNSEKGEPAYKTLKKLSEDKLAKILLENSDEPLSDVLAKAIVKACQSETELSTTWQLREVIEKVLPRQKTKDDEKLLLKKTCQRVFQALRIYINEEFVVLDQLLAKIPDCLVSGGRVAFLTFHSGEDRRVKLAFKKGFHAGIYKDFLKNPIRASDQERIDNPRSTSAKLRYAIKV